MTYPKLKNTVALMATAIVLAACGDNAGNESTVADTTPTEAAPAEIESPAFPAAALIDPNSATEEELAAVPGMTEAARQAILASRPYSTPSELDAAIGDSLDADGRKAVYAMVFVKVGLNSGAEDDYKLIPSTLSPRHLAHEFEEYRPYESMEQFSREMSKYVSDEEVAYLERFVTLD